VKNKEQFFNEIFEICYPKVYRLCLGYFKGDTTVAEDVVQEVFIRVWLHMDTFREESTITTWVYRITVNTCLMELRKNKPATTPAIPSQIDSEPQADDNEQERIVMLNNCISQLEPVNKLIILLVLENTAYTEIASITGLNETALRVRIHRIKKRLTKCVTHES